MKSYTFRLAMCGIGLLDEVRCTPAERQAVLYADQALCAVPHALKGATAETLSDVCAIELPIAQALVTAKNASESDAGKP